MQIVGIKNRIFQLIVLLLITFHLVDSQCFDLVNQYYQCRNLTMIKSRDRLGEIYLPDAKVPNNTLSDSFYKSLGLDSMTFNQAINQFKSIYTEIVSCKNSTFCDCIGSRYSKNYAQLFTNDTILNQARPILSSFVTKNQASLLDFSILQNMFSDGIRLPTLAKFCVNYEFAGSRLTFYKNLFKCQSQPDFMVSFHA